MIDFALDTYIDAVRSNPVVSVSGVVVNVEAVTAQSETMGTRSFDRLHRRPTCSAPAPERASQVFW
jgi:hypothetical protein